MKPGDRKNAARDRVRRYRQRQPHGLRAFRIWADDVRLPGVLVAGGFLDANLADDHAAVEAALQRWVNAAVAVTRYDAPELFPPYLAG
jgi:hypothetical protein